MRNQRGIALVIVLWVTVLLSVIAGSFAVIARTESLQARHMFDQARARYAAEAGLHRAVYNLSHPDQQSRWQTDGRWYDVKLGEAEVEVAVIDESGKIDLNAAGRETLLMLFKSKGLKEQRRNEIVDAILDWRDSDDDARLFGVEAEHYEDAGFPYTPKNGPFSTIAEVQQVMGVDYELFRQIEPAVTVYSGRGSINLAAAPREVLLTFEGMTPELVDQWIAQRRQALDNNQPPPPLPNGSVPDSRGGGVTFTVRSRATLANGATAGLEATIRLARGSRDQAFMVMDWDDGHDAISDQASAASADRQDGGGDGAPRPSGDDGGRL